MKPWLVFGLSGQVGQAVRSGRNAGDAPWFAVSRHPPAPEAGIAWTAGSLAPGATFPASPGGVLSLGPLDAFARWFVAKPPDVARVVALGSTSRSSKSDSAEPRERHLAQALLAAEAELADTCRARGIPLVLLRPTLIYGNGRDHSLSRFVRLARRWRWIPLPAGPLGLRQPVHVDDVAAAALRCLRSPQPIEGGYDLPGGEVLPFDVMLERTLRAAVPGAGLLRIPGPMFRAGARILRGTGALDPAAEGLLARLGRDQVYDPEPARIAMGHAPRGFQPEAGMFPE